jgi:hypothetical protein
VDIPEEVDPGLCLLEILADGLRPSLFPPGDDIGAQWWQSRGYMAAQHVDLAKPP